MNSIKHYKAKLIFIPVLIIGFIIAGSFLGTMKSEAENIRFKNVEAFWIIAIFPPIVLGFYLRYLIKAQRKYQTWREQHR